MPKPNSLMTTAQLDAEAGFSGSGGSGGGGDLGILLGGGLAAGLGWLRSKYKQASDNAEKARIRAKALELLTNELSTQELEDVIKSRKSQGH